MLENDLSSVPTPMAEVTENVAPAGKRPWKTPAFEEMDYRITEATLSGVGGDLGFYS